jgi:hypothetical protein
MLRGVPELWRVSEHGVISIWRLDEGSYPNLPLDLLNEHLGRAGKLAMSRLVKSFRQALRRLGPAYSILENAGILAVAGDGA